MKRDAIPDHWRIVRLDEVAKLQTGLALGKSGIVAPVRLPYLRVANVQDGYLDLTVIKEVEVNQKEAGRYSLQPGDVLFTEGGDFDKLGRGAVWRGQIGKCLHQNHVFAVRVDRLVLLPEYLTAYSSSSQGKAYFLGCSKQSTNLASINSSQLKAMPLALPPLAEQQKITAVISTWDRAIELTSQRITATRRRKATLMAQLLTGKVRFPEFVESPDWHPTPVGEMPMDWKSHRLGSVVSRVKRKNTVGETHVLTASGEHGLVDQREFFNRSVAGANLAGYYLLKRGEFAYNRSAMKGYPFGAIKRLDRYEQGVLSTLYVCFGLSDDACDLDFMAHYFEARLLDRQLGEVTQVGGRAHGLLNITDRDFYSLHVVLPGIDSNAESRPF